MILYAAIKFIAYALWCFIGLRLFAPTRASAVNALKFGALRWLLGLAFGVTVGVLMGSTSPDTVALLYFGIYVPLRIVEWGIMAKIMRLADTPLLKSRGIWLWIAGGVALSFATDLASPEGMAGRFCVGRCLC